MTGKSTNLQLGGLAIALSAFLLIYGIPNWVGAPKRVPNILLSPLFWPNVLAGVTGLVGGLLVLSGLYGDAPAEEEPLTQAASWDVAAKLRLLISGGLMYATLLLIPRIGMVWTSMLVFAGLCLMLRTRFPRSALICAVALPLFLYAFFAHVAGVAIPQGEFVRLP